MATDWQARIRARAAGLILHRDNCSGLYDVGMRDAPPDSQGCMVEILHQVTLHIAAAYIANPVPVDMDAMRAQQDSDWERLESQLHAATLNQR